MMERVQTNKSTLTYHDTPSTVQHSVQILYTAPDAVRVSIMCERNCMWHIFLPVYFYCLCDLAVNIHIKILDKPQGTTKIKFWYKEITCIVFHLILLSSGTITQPVKW